MRRNIILSAALAASLALPTLAYAAAASDATQGQGGTGTGAAGSNFDKPNTRSGSTGVKHTMNNTKTAPASGGSAGTPGGGGCDPAATGASASAPVGQAAPGCK